MHPDGIDVITPCRNAEVFLLDCLESVQAQGMIARRHIVIDGGSTDNSVRILQEYGRTHDHLEWMSEPDHGQSDALNKGLDRVRTEYFGWLNADDRYVPGGLSALASAIEPPPKPAIIYGDYQRIDAAGRIVAHRPQPTFSLWDCLHAYLTVQNSSALFQTQLTRQLGGFDCALQFAMDYDLIVRLASHGGVRHVRAYGGQFRVHPEAKTSRLQQVGQAEVRKLRARHTGGGNVRLRFLWLLGLTRVVVRMTREGCLSARLRPRL